jgi:hypothetical protein
MAIMLSTIAAPLDLLAETPQNDNFSSPVVMTGLPASFTGSNMDATTEIDEPLPNEMEDYAGASVWFR